jgi:hypothetical protein
MLDGFVLIERLPFFPVPPSTRSDCGRTDYNINQGPVKSKHIIIVQRSGAIIYNPSLNRRPDLSTERSIVCGASGRYDAQLAAFACPCGRCNPVWQSRADLYALGYFPCCLGVAQGQTYASMDVFKDFSSRQLHHPGSGFETYVNELDDRSKQHGCVSMLLLFLIIVFFSHWFLT